MSRPRQIAFRSLQVHRPASAPSGPPAVPRAHPGFEALLRRRTAPAQSRTDLPAFAEQLAQHVAQAAKDGDSQQNESADDEQPADEPEDRDWAQALMPTCAGLDQLLATAVPGCRDEERTPRMLETVARTIAGFCNERAVDDSEGWNVRMPLRSDVLEDTTLELAISSHWLQLRFLTSNAGSRKLISQHQDVLRSLLTGLLNRQREIAIGID